MDGAFDADGLAPGPNLSSAAPRGWNLSSTPLWATPGQAARAVSAAVITLLGLVGNGLLLHRLRCGGCCCAGRFARRRKVDFLLAHLAAADLYGCGLALLAQLPPADGQPGEAAAAAAAAAGWPSGDATCRLFRLLQGSGLLAPAHMLVLLALERRRVARAPPQPPLPPAPTPAPARGALAALGWLLALLLALPQAFVYRLAPAPGAARCLSVWPQRPPWHGRAYAVYGALTSFVAPACLLGGTCGRLLGASRAQEQQGQAQPGARRAPRSLPRARARALQLTVALAALFALCGFPRVVLELAWAFACPDGAAEAARATLGGLLAAANCALNPFVCLVFRSQRPWARRLQSSLCRCPDGQPRRRAPRRHRPPPQGAAERPGRWLCPCQIPLLNPLTENATKT
uniref:probable G-protein coupled receptor 150 n=1 Tax=Euleptes europaea TaxID=460621 RepID=UPI0025410433|nr:probable G-protein coupled receptor 150 [Euleptes europaea]